MSILTKIALGMMGQLRPKPALGTAASSIPLPAPEKRGGMPLLEALASAGLTTVNRAWIDREAIATALRLSRDQHTLLSQTIGHPRS